MAEERTMKPNPDWKETQGVAVFEGWGYRPDLFIDANKMIWVRRGTPSHQAVTMMEERLQQAEALNSKANLDE